MMHPFPNQLFRDSVELLSGETDRIDNHAGAWRFLDDIGYTEFQANEDRTTQQQHINILKVAAKLDLFALDVPDAPYLYFMGGKVSPDLFDGFSDYAPSSTSGISTDIAGAFESCVAERVEYLSQHPTAEDFLNQNNGQFDKGNSVRWNHYQSFKPPPYADRLLEAKELTTRTRIGIPQSLCLRNVHSKNLHGMSTGCAAGRSLQKATLSALLELIERDAAALWWEGGKAPRPVSIEAICEAGIEYLYNSVGRRSNKKTTLLLDITTDVGIPVIAAISTDLQNANRFACGLACRVNLKDAIYKAVLEMLQMEVGHHVLALKQRVHGSESLNEKDVEQVNRTRLLADIWSRTSLKTQGQPQLPTLGTNAVSYTHLTLPTIYSV